MRTGYENPIISLHREHLNKLPTGGLRVTFSKDEQNRTEFLAKSLADIEDNYNEIRICPVCGVKSFVSFEEMDGVVDNDGNLIKQWTYIYNVRCLCCSFELFYDDFRTLKDSPLKIDDYWHIEEF